MKVPTLPAPLTAVTLAGLALAAVGVATSTATASSGSAFLTPTVTSHPVPDPGVLLATDAHGVKRYVVLQTGSWDSERTVSTATNAASSASWQHVTDRRLLDHLPRTASAAEALWAPSGTYDPATGRYYTFYSAPVAHHVHDAKHAPRCIYAGHTVTDYLDPTAATPLGSALFQADDTPLVCWSGSGTGAPDSIRRVASNYTLIDPTPAWLGGKLYLTYKTAHHVGGADPWVTTIRMVRLDPSSPDTTVLGRDRQLTSWTSPSIEENPVLVRHGGRFVLFTSRGWYHSPCTTSRFPYHTVYRVSRSKWHWPTKVHTLPVPGGTCGTGNAQPTASLGRGGDRFFFNGRWKKPKSPEFLYVGRLTWSGSTPEVTRIFH